MKIAQLLRDMDPQNLSLLEMPSAKKSSEKMLISQWIFLREERTKNLNRLHAELNQCGIPYLKKSDLREAGKRRSLIAQFLSPIHAAETVANMLDDSINLLELQLGTMEDKIIRSNEYESLSWLSIP